MADLRRPPALRSGDTIALLAPSRPGHPRLLDAATSYLKGRGYRVWRSPSVTRRYHYLGGTDAERAEAVMAAFGDERIAALLCARGGFGAGRVLDRLDYDLIARHPKPVIGFSDTTALHLALYRRCGLVGFTGALADTDLSRHPVEPLLEDSLWSLLTDTEGTAPSLPAAGARLVGLRPGVAQGPLVAANLALLCSLLGTPYAPDLDGAVLLVEDVGEAPYRVDRMLTQLRLAGVLDRIAALVLGTFQGCFEPTEMTQSPTLEEIVADHVGSRPLPVVTGAAYGHQPRRVVLPLGVPARVDAGAGRVDLLEPAVAPR